MLSLYNKHIIGVQNRVALNRPPHNHKDVGSNPAATRNENWTLGDIWVEKPAISKLN